MIKVAIIGPESTGKSVLAQRLSEYFESPWVPEYARQYVEQLDRAYTYEDVCNIARFQIEQEKHYEFMSMDFSPAFVFFDTELIITTVWMEYCYGKVPEFVRNRVINSIFDFYILCAPDLPWEPDPVREHGTDREFFFDWYRREIEKTERPYFVVDGVGERRLQNAVNAIERFVEHQVKD